MSEVEEVKVYIKAVINKSKTKVLFVEAGSDFADAILNFLTLPLGTIVRDQKKKKKTIVRDLKKHYGDEAPVIGSLNTLYDGVANLDIAHFYSPTAKETTLNTLYDGFMSSRRQKFNFSDPSRPYSGKTYDGVFTKSADSFIISDDLLIIPAGFVMNTLGKLGIAITEMDGAETRTVAFGFDKIMDLLKESLISRNPLTTLLLSGSRMNLATVKYEHRITHIDEKAISMNSKKIVWRVMLQKSTSKLLFAQANPDFINFLLALLILPLGRIEWYLGSNTGYKNIDNLYNSLSDAWMKDYLMKPPVYQNYSSNDFIPLNFELNNVEYPIKGSRTYIVNDDLRVAPMAITPILSVINELKNSFSDVVELELEVDLEEGLNIVKSDHCFDRWPQHTQLVEKTKARKLSRVESIDLIL